MRMRVTLFILAISILANAVFVYRNLHTANEQGLTQYPYLSKRIFAENQNNILVNFIPLREAIRNYIFKQPSNQGKIGLYFEYLPSGTSIGVNEQLEVKIASLIKIPVAMAVYKAIEKQKLTLDQMITIDKDDLDDSFGDLWKRGPGTKITIKEALDFMLKQSDNTSVRATTDVLPEFAIEQVFDNLDIPKDRKDGYAIISPKNYTSILRSLYLSSYLSRDHSNDILTTLTQTNFNERIPAGVPRGIVVAHKIGTFDIGSDHDIYSDCGIIYAPNRPYSLCMITDGYKEKDSIKHMQLLSKMVYGYVSQVN